MLWSIAEPLERVRVEFLKQMSARAESVLGSRAVSLLDAGTDELGGFFVFEDAHWETLRTWTAQPQANVRREHLADIASSTAEDMASARLVHGHIEFDHVWVSATRLAVVGFGARAATSQELGASASGSLYDRDQIALGAVRAALLSGSTSLEPTGCGHGD